MPRLACILSGRQKTCCKNVWFSTFFNSQKHVIYYFFSPHKIPQIVTNFIYSCCKKWNSQYASVFKEESWSYSKLLQKTLVLFVQKLLFLLKKRHAYWQIIHLQQEFFKFVTKTRYLAIKLAARPKSCLYLGYKDTELFPGLFQGLILGWLDTPWTDN